MLGKGVGPVVGAGVGDSASSSLLEEALLEDGCTVGFEEGS